MLAHGSWTEWIAKCSILAVEIKRTLTVLKWL